MVLLVLCSVEKYIERGSYFNYSGFGFNKPTYFLPKHLCTCHFSLGNISKYFSPSQIFVSFMYYNFGRLQLNVIFLEKLLSLSYCTFLICLKFQYPISLYVNAVVYEIVHHDLFQTFNIPTQILPPLHLPTTIISNFPNNSLSLPLYWDLCLNHVCCNFIIYFYCIIYIYIKARVYFAHLFVSSNSQTYSRSFIKYYEVNECLSEYI